LERQRKEEIVTFNDLMWETESQKMDWNSALNYAKKLQLGGYDDWRLPTVEELKEAVKSCGGIPVYLNNKDRFSLYEKNRVNIQYQNCYKDKGFKGRWYRSSTSLSDGTKDAWDVNFNDGDVNYHSKKNSSYFRCVRKNLKS
jgi:hypothetical protein